ncbi:hypothetical protein B0T16DRAFT_438610 [Cercophora newfieldiana]|uniref:DUF6594 domain-containing protein n=1 Tax=Cercophora newfieldiana TaxID=92897 RepID=A0AA39XWY6_9PEZI|nr:hypothetical protein B0T16DRAFT_438610 [Cercophora newfieldiana]
MLRASVPDSQPVEILVGFGSNKKQEEFHFLRFEFLQRLNLAKLQVDLVRTKSRFQRNGCASADDLKELKVQLEDYTTAIRNYQYLHSKKPIHQPELAKRKLLLEYFFQRPDDFQDPFHSHYAYFREATAQIDPLRLALMRSLPSRLAWSPRERRQRKKEYTQGLPPQQVSIFVDRLVRFMTAITGGVFLVVPMVIMTIDQSQNKSLITVSLAVVTFALVLSLAIRVSNIETLVATATYAAVLVVFVGTSNAVEGQSSSSGSS